MTERLNCTGECVCVEQCPQGYSVRFSVSVAAELNPESPAPVRRRWGWWLLLAVLTLLSLLLVFGPSLFGKALLARLSGSYAVTAQGVNGPLWSPTVSGLRVSGPGVDVRAGSVVLGLSGVNLINKSARLDLSLNDADVKLRLKTLLGGKPQSGGGGFTLLPGNIDVQNTRLSIDGTGFEVPSGSWTAQSLKTEGQDALKISGATTDGPLNALLRYRTVNRQLQGSADLTADARIINHYWHDKKVGGVTGGQLSGRYRFGSGPVVGDIRLTDTTLAVPGAEFVQVKGLNGTAAHRGDLISFQLTGTGFDGPVTATGSVDLKAHQWDVKAEASPLFSALSKALGQSGKGVGSVTVHAYGWSTVTVKADVSSPQGEFSVLPYRNLKASYLYRRDRAELNNDLTFSADTRFQGQQKLSGQWTFNKAGTLTWTGDLLSKPLNLKGTISAKNVISAQGQAFGGPLRGSLGLADKAVTLAASPDFYSVSGDVTAQGTLDRLNLALSSGRAGPVDIAGTAVFGTDGLNADLGPIQLRLDRQLRGRWQADGLSTAGLLITGAGDLKVPEATLTGQLRAAVPLLRGQPSGPIALNWQTRRADWSFSGGNLTWRGDTFALTSSGLNALGYDLRGTLALTTALKASGRVRASNASGSVVANGAGDHIDLNAMQGGVSVTARTLLTAGFPTTARVQGADISGTVTVDQGAKFTLRTGSRSAQGRLNAEGWDASGDIDLAALRPLIGGNLSGTARLNLAGQDGTVDFAGSGFGASLNGVLTRSAGILSAQTAVRFRIGTQSSGTQGSVAAQLSGRVFPDLDLSGPVTLLGLNVGNQILPTQTVQAQLSGPYSGIRAAINGRLTAITAGGLTLPSQPLALQANLNPALKLSGSYGDLNLRYALGAVQVQGTQLLSGYGESGQVKLSGSYGPNWTGQLTASGTFGPYVAQVSGPWRALNVGLSTQGGLRASGTLNAVTQGYDLRVRGPVAGLAGVAGLSGLNGLTGLYVQGTIAGTGAAPRGNLSVTDGSGGRARVTVNGLKDFQIQASSFRLAGQKFQGNLSAAGGLLSGTLSAGPLNIVANNGQFQASGKLSGYTLNATGRLALPSTLTGLNLSVTGPYLSAMATGSGTDLRGTMTLKAQQYNTVARLPAQLLPLRASIFPLSADLGGLKYDAGPVAGWTGQTRLKYVYGAQVGTLALVGSGSRLSVLPTGPLAGRLQVLPTLSGSLSAPVSPLLTLLPAQFASTIIPGRLNARIGPSGTSAALTLESARYLGRPLGLSATVNWRRGVTASGALTHPGSTIPFVYDGQNLSVSGARLDALALKPLLGTLNVTGSIRADLSLPGLKLEKSQAEVRLDLQAAGQQARGTVRLAGGTLRADLNSTLGGQTLRLVGPLYPQASAALQYGELRAALNGDLRTRATLDVSGSYNGRSVALSAVGGLNPGQIRLTGAVAGLDLNVRAGQRAGANWTLGGTFGAPDLSALLGTVGSVSGTLGGSLGDLRLNAAGRVGGADFTLPARLKGGVLSVQGASVALPGTAIARLSGTVYPALKLSGPLTLSDYMPGSYALSAQGSLGKPDLRLNGRTTGGPRGLDAPGSTVTARLLGRDWKVTASGKTFSGDARGQFASGKTSTISTVPAGLIQARLTVAAPYRTPSQTIRLDGTSGWSQAGGFLGDLRVGGILSGKALSARLRGNGDLSAEASLGQLLGTDPERANVSARFPASLPLRPGGSLTLRSLDLGAFWGRPEQLSLSADAALTGRSWSELGAALKGNLNDQTGELSGAISTSLSNGALALALEGRKLSGSATLKGSEYAAALSSSGASLARLLPASAGVSALTLSGQASLSGSTQAGVRELGASGLDLRGSQSQTGPFNLTGSVLYTPFQTQASLDGTVFGGTLSAAGSLPGGLNVTLNALKPAALGVDNLDGQLRLSGKTGNPTLSGRLNLTRPELTASVDLSGLASDPRLNAAATLRGQYAGRLLAQVSSLKLSPLSAELHVYGAASQGANRVNLDLSGRWPRLAGTATVNVGGLKEPVTLQGDGQGSYALKAGALGSGTVKLEGLVPTIAATARLTPLTLLNQSGIAATGEASADVSLSGPLGALNLTAQASVQQAEVSGVSVAGLALNIAGPLTGPKSGAGALAGTLSQDGQAVGTLAGGNLIFNDLKAGGYGLQASASGRATLSGTGSAALKVSGAGVQADLKAAYAGGSVSLSGAATASGVQASLNSTGSLNNGWTGTLTLEGGPAGVLTSPGRFTLSGPLTQPLLAGQIGLADAGVKVVANRQNMQLRLTDGPGVQASGVLNLDLQKSLWEGQVVYTRPEASLAVKLSGAAGSPQAAVDLTRGSWKASGTLSPTGADLYVSDGSGQTQPAQTQATQSQPAQAQPNQPTQGRIRWDGQTLGVNLPGLLLDTLDVGTLGGRLRATGSVDTRTLDGAVQFALNSLQTGYIVPDLNLPVDGDLSGTVTLRAGQVQASASLKSGVGTVDLSLRQPQKGGSYTGSLRARIVQPASAASGPAASIPVTASEGGTTASATITAPQVIRAGGTLNADLTLGAPGLTGEVVAQSLNLDLGGLNARLSGSVALTGQSFTLQAGASSSVTGDEAQVSLTGSGGLADVLPALTPLTGIQPVGSGYSLRAALNGLELSGLKVAPNLSGRVSGEASISDGGGTFVLRSNALRLGDTTLSTRIDGTLVGDGSLVGKKDLLGSDWRIRGVVGNSTAATSQLSASLSGGLLSGTFQMRGLPLDAFVSAFSGTLPGRGQLTGLARFRLPLADPLAGEVNVVAERLTVSSTMLATPATPLPAATKTSSTQGPAVQTPAPPVPQTPITQTPVTQTLAGSGFIRYANRELQSIDLRLSGAGRWDVTGQYTRQNVAVTASFQNTTFTPVLLFIPSLREQSPSLQGTLSLSVAGSYERPVGNVSGSNLSGALGSISLSIPALSGQLPDSGLFSVQAPMQAGGALGADGNVKVTGRLDNLNLKALSVLYSGVLIPQGLGRVENVQATVSQVNAGQPGEGYTLTAQAVGGLGVGSLNVQGSLSPLYDLKASARNFNLPISVIYGRQSRINADLSIAEQGRAGADGPILITGAVNVASLVLGTGGASTAVLPAPASVGAAAGGGASSEPGVNYASPLPEELTTFPRPQQQAAVKKVSPLLSRLTFQNIPISAPGGIRVDESIARAELSGSLVLSGTGSAPRLLGEVKAIRGTVDLRDNSFAIDSGSAVFGGASLYPVLSVSATGDVPLGAGGLVGVNLALDGRFGPQPGGSNALTINTRLSCVRNCVSSAADLSSSNPNAEAQLYSLVAVGTPNLASLPSNLGTLGTSALKTALNLFVLGEVQRNIARALGVDVFRINAALPGENGSTGFGATFTVGSYLTRQLYLQYQVDLTGLGLINATYTTPNNLFTLKAGTTIQGVDLNSLNLSFSAAYNFTNRSSVQLGVASGDSTKINFGYVYRW